jgi:SAM-dependent methyltransferase
VCSHARLAGVERQRWNDRYSAADRNPLNEPNALVVEELAATPPGRALDVAAGEGRHARWLAAKGWDVVAVDFSEVAVRRAGQLAPHINCVVADVHTLPLPPARFDLILATFFHPRPAERPGLYRKMSQALAPGGSLLVVTFDKRHQGAIDPDFLLDPPALAADLEALGLDITRAETIDVPDGVNAVVRAEKPRSPRPAAGAG